MPYALPYTFIVPNATRVRLQAQSGGRSSCQNLSLLLHHYVPREVISGRGDIKQQWLAQIAERSKSQSAPLIDRQLHEAWLQRWTALAGARGAIRFTAKCAWRMVVGLGGESPVETDMTVHPIYGIPYIPGSALKGLMRAYALLERVGGDSDGSVDKPPAAVERICGIQQQSGAAVFFDAMPAPGVRLDVDIMNPHYPDYYRDVEGKRAPGNDQNPIPVYFLTVAPGSTFHFAVAPRTLDGTRDDVQTAATWLRQALKAYGAGAKTAAGYGRFEDFARR